MPVGLYRRADVIDGLDVVEVRVGVRGHAGWPWLTFVLDVCQHGHAPGALRRRVVQQLGRRQDWR